MVLIFLKYLAVFVLALTVFMASFFGTTLLTCYLNPEFDRVLWVRIDAPDD
jgi:uncharacterized membrane-anchored protein